MGSVLSPVHTVGIALSCEHPAVCSVCVLIYSTLLYYTLAPACEAAFSPTLELVIRTPFNGLIWELGHHLSERAMTPHSSTLAWKLPWTEEPGGLRSHGVAKSWTRLSDFTFTFHSHVLEKEMVTHSRVLAWRNTGTGEPGGCRLWGHTESDTTEAA